MIFLGQDKGRGPKWPKPLSAHLFSRDARGLGWDAVLALCPIIYSDKPGTWIERDCLAGVWSNFR